MEHTQAEPQVQEVLAEAVTLALREGIIQVQQEQQILAVVVVDRLTLLR